jgi:hypothetical protein
VGVIQHPEDCPLTEATGLVLLLSRPEKGSELRITELTSDGITLVGSLQALRLQVYLTSLITLIPEEQKLQYPFLLATKLHKGSSNGYFGK